MTKATLNEAHADSGDGTPTFAAPNKRIPQVFDERGRTIPWMARTVHRLYNDQAQKILDEENITIAHWIYLRVLAERGELNQLELSKRVGMASTTAVPALDSMEKRGLLKKKARSEGSAQILRRPYRQGAAFGRQAVAENRQYDCRIAAWHCIPRTRPGRE
jgi:DNA-binding MarR family transcriptional regulator